MALRDELGEVGGDGAGAAADVEDGVGGADVREEVGGVTGGGAGCVGFENGGGVAVDVGGHFLWSFGWLLVRMMLRIALCGP